MKLIRLENRSPGHSKFYELWAGAYENTVTGKTDKAFVGTRFGKIGTQGQTKMIEFEGEGCKAKAWELVQKKIKEKQAHGYELVEEATREDSCGWVGIDQAPGAQNQQMMLA